MGTIFPYTATWRSPSQINYSFNGEINTSGYRKLQDISTLVKCDGIEVQFSTITGAIVHLVDMRQPSKPVSYADTEAHRLAEILY